MNKEKKMPVLPVEAYTSQEWFNLEQEQIFSKTWQFAGFKEDVKEPGDYITIQAGLYNILVVRGNDQRLRAFHNICRHRGTQLLRAVGKTEKAITCPYHDWTYGLDGQLQSVPQEKSEFPDLNKKKLCLHKASVEIWRGMIWVHPNPNCEPLLTWLGKTPDYVGPHNPDKLIEYENTSSEHIINANWKIVVENYIDGYHLAHLHANTLNMYNHAQQKSHFCGPHYLFYEPISEDYRKNIKTMAPYPLIDAIPKDKLGAWVPLLFPNLGLGESESDWSIFHVVPLAPDKTKVVIRSKLMPISSTEYLVQGMRSWAAYTQGKAQGEKYDPNDPMQSGDFMEEDIYACEQQQKSLKSPLFSVGATAQNLEYSVRKFQEIVHAFVKGNNFANI